MDCDNVVDMSGVQAFKEKMMTEEPSKNVTLVSYLYPWQWFDLLDILTHIIFYFVQRSVFI